jgi:hypothetical protein
LRDHRPRLHATHGSFITRRAPMISATAWHAAHARSRSAKLRCLWCRRLWKVPYRILRRDVCVDLTR